MLLIYWVCSGRGLITLDRAAGYRLGVKGILDLMLCNLLYLNDWNTEMGNTQDWVGPIYKNKFRLKIHTYT